jgi:hypothetical protein
MLELIGAESQRNVWKEHSKLGRWDGSSKSNKKSGSRIGFWIMIWVVWLFFFIVILPSIMCGGDTGCASVDSSNLLYLWWFLLTLGGGTIPYLSFVFGVWAGLLVIGFLDSMD